MRSETTPVRIEHLALRTDQLERLRDFYTHQLGAQAEPPRENAATGRRSARLDFCGVQLVLVEAPAAAEQVAGGQPGCAQIGFALGSADAVDELSGRLAAAGHRLLEPPGRTRAGHYQSLALDPDGNLIALTV
jgi:lactoylglutathione lyase